MNKAKVYPGTTAKLSSSIEQPLSRDMQPPKTISRQCTFMAGVLQKVCARLSIGIALQQKRAYPQLRTTLPSCITAAREFPRIIRKQQSGLAGRQSRETL